MRCCSRARACWRAARVSIWRAARVSICRREQVDRDKRLVKRDNYDRLTFIEFLEALVRLAAHVVSAAAHLVFSAVDAGAGAGAGAGEGGRAVETRPVGALSNQPAPVPPAAPAPHRRSAVGRRPAVSFAGVGGGGGEEGSEEALEAAQAVLAGQVSTLMDALTLRWGEVVAGAKRARPAPAAS